MDRNWTLGLEWYIIKLIVEIIGCIIPFIIFLISLFQCKETICIQIYHSYLHKFLHEIIIRYNKESKHCCIYICSTTQSCNILNNLDSKASQ